MASTSAKRFQNDTPPPTAALRPTSPKGKGAAAKQRIKGETAPPDYLLRLMKHVGPSQAARMLGTTPGTLHKARNANAVTPALEIAARGLWREHGYVEGMPAPRQAQPRTTDMHQAVGSPLSEDTVLYLIQVSRDRAPILERTAEALGAQVMVQA